MTVHLRFQETFPLRIPEWVMAAMMLDWGRKALTHPDIFSNSPALHQMGEIMPHWAWGAFGFGLGAVGLASLAINGFWKATPFLRAVSSFGRMFLWLQIQFGLWASGVPTTGTSIYIGLAALEVWNLYRAGGDARRALA